MAGRRSTLLLSGHRSRLDAMSRRLGVLALLLLCLTGFAPSIWACTAMEQHRDCCPPGHSPCDLGKAPPSLTGLAAAACCTSQSTPTQSAASPRTQEEPTLSANPPTGGAQRVASVPDAERAQRVDVSLHLRFLTEPDQQQIYLQTGRLRL